MAQCVTGSLRIGKRAFGTGASGRAELYRAVSVDASPDVVFRWLCQLRVAPYSHDWIDNWGRRSPPQLTPGLERLSGGQVFMGIFELVDFVPDRHVTLRIHRASLANGCLATSPEPISSSPGSAALACWSSFASSIRPAFSASA